jgi:hypothetical protein
MAKKNNNKTAAKKTAQTKQPVKSTGKNKASIPAAELLIDEPFADEAVE